MRILQNQKNITKQLTEHDLVRFDFDSKFFRHGGHVNQMDLQVNRSKIK